MSRLSFFASPVETDHDQRIYQILLKKKHEISPSILFFYQLNSLDPQKIDIYVINPKSKETSHHTAWSDIRNNRTNEEVVSKAIALSTLIPQPPRYSSSYQTDFNTWKLAHFNPHKANITYEEFDEEKKLLQNLKKGRRNAIVDLETHSPPEVDSLRGQVQSFRS